MLHVGPRDAPSAEICFLEAPLFQSFNVEIFTKVFVCTVLRKSEGLQEKWTASWRKIFKKEKEEERKRNIPDWEENMFYRKGGLGDDNALKL